MSQPRPFLIDNRWISTDAIASVINPASGRAFATVCQAGKKEAEQAIKSGLAAFAKVRRQPTHETVATLFRVVAELKARRWELVETIVDEAGKPVAFAETEVNRTITTFTLAAAEAGRIGGEYMPLDVDAGSTGRIGVTKRVPVGLILGICPFNFPLNLVAHKVAPALASNNAIIIKPAPQTPLTALLLGEILLDAGVPRGQVNILPTSNEIAQSLVEDDRVAKLSFTGSVSVGWRLKSLAGKKRVTLELGGNAAAVVMDDADLSWAVPRLVVGAFGYAGQTCIAVQRILVQRNIYDRFMKAFVKEVRAKAIAGSPKKRATLIGPMIDKTALDRTDAWVKEAIAAGAKLHTGGKKKGRCYEATVLSGAPKNANVVCQEAFAPVVVVEPFGTMKQAIDKVNDSAFGLQVGVFTNRMDDALYAFDEAEVGGVIVNDFPTFRVDSMPYGGVKESGVGKEGIRSAIEEMTEVKLMVMWR